MQQGKHAIPQNTNAYMVMTRGQAKAVGAVAPPVHGVNKPLDPDKRPEKDISLQKQIIPGNISAGSSVEAHCNSK